jgi:uncharacterized RDD family membrane protein YckC
MSEINIVTAQNVTLKIELANIGDRFLAAILDFLIKLGMIFLALIVFSIIKIEVLSVCVCILIWCAYSLIFELAMQGQTPGKRIMKIRVVPLDGDQLTFGSILIRWFFRLIDFPFSYIPTVGICAIVISEKHQRLGDMVAGTILVSTKQRVTLGETVYTATEQGYVPVFPQAERLTASEAEIIKEVLHQYLVHDKHNLITLTAQKLKSALSVYTNLDDISFLKAIMKDYNVTLANQGKAFDNNERFAYSGIPPA